VKCLRVVLVVCSVYYILSGCADVCVDSFVLQSSIMVTYMVCGARRCDVGDFGVHVLVESRAVDQFFLFSKVGLDLIE
jgi:hypothetical protein